MAWVALRQGFARGARIACLSLLVGLPPWIAQHQPPPGPPLNEEPSTSASPFPTDTQIPSETSTPFLTPTDTPALETPTPTATHSPTFTETPTTTETPTVTPFPTGPLRINEVAWSGTLASANDEWIELHNPGALPVDLTGWTLSDGGDIHVALSGAISGFGFFLLERTDDATVVDIPADQIYVGSLSNAGETLRLVDPMGAPVDSANAAGGPWPAGYAETRASMERRGADDVAGNWSTFPGVGGNGHDAAGNGIQGTPRSQNSAPVAPASPTPSPTPSPGSPPTPFPPYSVLINEVAWAGTLASANDEWIELYNPGPSPIDLLGWALSDGDDISLALTGIVDPGGYLLLERSDDTAIDDITADQIYTGSLHNDGETLWLRDPLGTLVDSANADGGPWPKGDADSRASMERRGGSDAPDHWYSFTGFAGIGHDVAGNPIQGTPRGPNSPPPPPLWIKGRIVINEVLIRPHYDWEGNGGVTSGDEFIELHNLGPGDVFLRGWMLDDIADGGSRPYILPGDTILPGGYVAYFRSKTGLALNDDGDSVRFLTPDGYLVDEIHYLSVRAYNLSYGRLPDGSGRLAYGLWPTPRRPNRPFVESASLAIGSAPSACPSLGPGLLRFARHPALARWLSSLGLWFCRP